MRVRVACFLLVLGARAAVAPADCLRCAAPVADLNQLATELVLDRAVDADGTTFVTVTRNVSVDCSGIDLAVSRDAGVSWRPPVRVDVNPDYTICGFTTRPSIASDGVRFTYLAWAGVDPLGSPALLSKTSPDRGASWPTSSVVVAPLAAAPADKGGWVVAGDGGVAWIVWRDGPSPSEIHLYSSRTENGGNTWSAPEKVYSGSPNPANGRGLFLRGRSDVLHVVFGADDGGGAGRWLHYARSVDRGDTWTVFSDVAQRLVPSSLSPTDMISLPGGELVLAWTDDRDGPADTLTRFAPDNGATWPESPQRTATGVAPGLTNSAVGVLAHAGGSRVVTAWSDRRDGYTRVYGNTSDDAGAHWSPFDFPIGADDPDSRIVIGPFLAAHSDGTVTAAWRDIGRAAGGFCSAPGTCYAFWAASSCDAGSSWEPDWPIFAPPSPAQNVQSGLLWAIPPGGTGLLPATVVGDIKFLRLDGPAAVSPPGPLSYCLGSDPLLQATPPMSAGCPGGFDYQWVVDGLDVPGATLDTWRPALGAGDHLVHVRLTCVADPACRADSRDILIRVRTAMVPPSVGNNLRAVRGAGGRPRLSWDGANPAPELHGHVRRAFTKVAVRPWPLVSPDPGGGGSLFDDDPPPAETLVLYDVRLAEPCETESAE